MVRSMLASTASSFDISVVGVVRLWAYGYASSELWPDYLSKFSTVVLNVK